jgi:murein DD-endopeptidase MepM/ murein hydrolase activator NlpD
MYLRVLLLFVCGFLIGAAAMYVLLWQGGVLSPYLENVRATSASVAAEGEADRAVPDTAPAPAPDPVTEPLPRLVPPIKDLKASDIVDTYKEARGDDHQHEATDIMAARGTPVVAMVDGVIKKLFVSEAGGNTIYQFDESEEHCYYYAHLDGYAEGIREGLEVARGTLIGYVGSTGNAQDKAPHLHLAIFRVGPEKHWWQGTAMNPYPVLMEALK